MVDTQEYLIFGIGNPLLDISLEIPDDTLLKKYGIAYGQACLAEEKHMPLYDEMWANDKKDTIPGGSALNSMRAANVRLAINGHVVCS